VVVVEGAKITAVGRRGEVREPEGPQVRVLEFPDGYLLPGLLDVHTHLMFSGTDASEGDEIAWSSDEIMLMQAARNAATHLRAGVTTLRDNGARNRITFNLRAAAQLGLAETPRLLLCGRPITITGGHFWWCNEEADGVDAVRRSVRRLCKEGADHIKIMASGGGTSHLSNYDLAYSTEELAAIVAEAHNLERLTTAHATATESMRRALEAQVDMMEHAYFGEPDESYAFDPRIADRIAKQGMYVSPTVQTGYRARQILVERAERQPLTPPEKQRLDKLDRKYEAQVSTLNRYWKEWRIPIVFGTDAPGHGYDAGRAFGRYVIGLELKLMAEAGMEPMEIIKAATSISATAVGLGHLIGTVAVGKEADLIVVSRDPLQNILALLDVVMVMKGGERVVLAESERNATVPLGA
jgi:imidazolonepropionase-like amidohydrolase